ncbi:hypothetical protein [Pseudobutyrivibrio sp.]|uniref:hypothetical protein n=1 Tax=Pseudobutyrivibrio sp. TaxID=2014367 RepID=UPI001D9E7CA8|nr:hypothetical protein [Pseudobutyrivibrio sp.]MBE5912019.1 hypothetical protein [Pseudobutyrivibrio sp.]
MNNTNNIQSRYLTVEELLILLYKGGIDGLIFPKEITSTHADGRTLKKAMSELVENGILIYDSDNDLVLAPYAKKWIDIFSEARETLVVHQNDESIVLYFYPVSESALCLNVDIHKSDMIRMEIMEKEEMILFLSNIAGRKSIQRIRRNERLPYAVVEEVEEI